MTKTKNQIIKEVELALDGKLTETRLTALYAFGWDAEREEYGGFIAGQGDFKEFCHENCTCHHPKDRRLDGGEVSFDQAGLEKILAYMEERDIPVVVHRDRRTMVACLDAGVRVLDLSEWERELSQWLGSPVRYSRGSHVYRACDMWE